MANYFILIFFILILNTSSKLNNEDNYNIIIDILVDVMGEPGFLSPLLLETNFRILKIILILKNLRI